MKYFLIALACSLATMACKHVDSKPSDNPESLPFKDSLDMDLSQLAATGSIPGFAVSFVNADGPIFQKAYGYSDLNEKRPYTKETIQIIASVSKTFIGVALMQLVEAGKVSLDDPINNYLPFPIFNPNHPDIAITFRMLATHTSSLDDYDDGDESVYWLLDPIPEPRSDIPEDILSRLEYFEIGKPITLAQSVTYALSTEGKWYDKENFLSTAPGTEMIYSNLSATLTAYLIEIISGQSFESYTYERIFKPLGMDNTAWHYADLDHQPFASIYTTYEEAGQTKTYPLPRNEHGDYPDGGLFTNLSELSKYISEMIRGFQGKGKLLSSEGYKTLFKRNLNDSHYPDGRGKSMFNDEYNYGIFWGRNHDGYIIHNGFDDGVTANVLINPKTGIGTIAFSNIGDNVFGEVLEIISKWEQRID